MFLRLLMALLMETKNAVVMQYMLCKVDKLIFQSSYNDSDKV